MSEEKKGFLQKLFGKKGKKDNGGCCNVRIVEVEENEINQKEKGTDNRESKDS